MPINKNIDEASLVELLKAQSKEGFDTLYSNYSAALYGITMKVIGDEELAKDLLQEVFIKIWKNIGQYDPAKGRLYTWLLNITRNTAIDKLRSKDFKRSEKNQSLDNYVYSLNEDSLASKTDAIGLKNIVKQLKPEQIEIIDMLYFKGYSQSEAAKELDLPLGTVKTRTRAALKELRKKAS